MGSVRANPQTDGERLVALETQVCNVEKQVTALDTKVDERFSSMELKLDRFIESADGKYAEKKVEKIVYGMVALTLSTVFLALLAIVVARSS